MMLTPPPCSLLGGLSGGTVLAPPVEGGASGGPCRRCHIGREDGHVPDRIFHRAADCCGDGCRHSSAVSGVHHYRSQFPRRRLVGYRAGQLDRHANLRRSDGPVLARTHAVGRYCCEHCHAHWARIIGRRVLGAVHHDLPQSVRRAAPTEGGLRKPRNHSDDTDTQCQCDGVHLPGDSHECGTGRQRSPMDCCGDSRVTLIGAGR